MEKFQGLPQELELPSAPKQFIQYIEEDNRPQVKLDVNMKMVWEFHWPFKRR